MSWFGGWGEAVEGPLEAEAGLFGGEHEGPAWFRTGLLACAYECQRIPAVRGNDVNTCIPLIPVGGTVALVAARDYFGDGNFLRQLHKIF